MDTLPKEETREDLLSTIQMNAKLRTLFALFTGRHPRIHRIPFGPIAGRNICIAPQMSPRAYLGILEPWMASVAREFINAGSVVYDIGAHIGYTSLVFAHLLEGKGAVHAFEILPSTVNEFLIKTLESNEFNNVFVHNVGLGQDTRELELPVGPTQMTKIDSTPHGGAKTNVCKIVPLDHYVAQNELRPPSFVKMDIEGAEIDCLHGGAQLINAYRPVMTIEFHSLRLLEEGYRLLASWGFRLVTDDGTNVDRQSVQQLKKFPKPVLCLPREMEFTP